MTTAPGGRRIRCCTPCGRGGRRSSHPRPDGKRVRRVRRVPAAVDAFALADDPVAVVHLALEQELDVIDVVPVPRQHRPGSELEDREAERPGRGWTPSPAARSVRRSTPRRRAGGSGRSGRGPAGAVGVRPGRWPRRRSPSLRRRRWCAASEPPPSVAPLDSAARQGQLVAGACDAPDPPGDPPRRRQQPLGNRRHVL